MEENPSQKSQNRATHFSTRSISTEKPRNSDAGGAPIKCSGKHCRSCTGGMIADCVALCCCPCAVVNFLALAFVKLPWMVGRRCLGRGKKKRESERKCKKIECECECEGGDRDGNFRKVKLDDGMVEIVNGFSEDDEDNVWLELYQFGHLGFGRVSFTGVQFQS